MMLRATLLCLAACGGGGGFPDAPPDPDSFPTGTMSLDWSLVRMSDGSPLQCSEIGDVVSVTLVLRNLGFQGGFTEPFTCNTKMGTTGPVPVGTYDVNFELNGATTIATAPEQRSIVVKVGQNTPLTPVTFSVNAVGTVDLRVDANKTGGNCNTIANMGAGITNIRITLNHSGGLGPCEPATLMVGGNSYTIDCANPANIPCFDNMTAITGTLPSDNYQIHVRADQVAAMNCFRNDDTIRVLPNNANLMRTLNLAAQSGGGCL